MSRVVPQTSREAMESISDSQLSDHHSKIILGLRFLREATAEEISNRIGLSHAQVNRRMTDLVEKGLIFNTKKKRKTSSGRYAFVFMLTGSESHPDKFSTYIQKDLF